MEKGKLWMRKGEVMVAKAGGKGGEFRLGKGDAFGWGKGG